MDLWCFVGLNLAKKDTDNVGMDHWVLLLMSKKSNLEGSFGKRALVRDR